MRFYGARSQTDLIPVPPDTVGVAVISTAGAKVALDYPSGAQLVAFGAETNFWAHMASTAVTIPTTNQAGSTTALSEYLRDGTMYQIPNASTGLSLTCASSQVITLSYWRK